MTTAGAHDVKARSPQARPVVRGRQLSDAERARTLAASTTIAALATATLDHHAHPFASVAPFGIDRRGWPVLCLSALAEHSRNLVADPRASLLVAEALSPGTDPLAGGRVTLVGRAARVGDDEVPAARALHLAANPHAAAYVDYGDFRLWRLEVERVRWVGGYGRMAWIDGHEWSAAEPDPLAPHAEAVLAHLNGDHAKACLALAHTVGLRPNAFVATAVGVDRYGLELAISGPGGPSWLRLPFDAEVATIEQAQSAAAALVDSAGGVPDGGP